MTPLRDIPDSAIVMYDTQDIESVLGYVGLSHLKHEITAVAVVVSDGDYSAVWLTESNRPYDIFTRYSPLPEYLESLPRKVRKFSVNLEYWQSGNPLYHHNTVYEIG